MEGPRGCKKWPNLDVVPCGSSYQYGQDCVAFGACILSSNLLPSVQCFLLFHGRSQKTERDFKGESRFKGSTRLLGDKFQHCIHYWNIYPLKPVKSQKSCSNWWVKGNCYPFANESCSAWREKHGRKTKIWIFGSNFPKTQNF